MMQEGMASPDWRAFDSIDTAYEAAGFLMAQNFLDALYGVLLPLVALVGMAIVFYQAIVKQDFKNVLLYFFYLLIVGFLLEPASAMRIPLGGKYTGLSFDKRIEGGTVLKAPRLLVWMNSGIDFLVGKAGGSAFGGWDQAFKMQKLTETLSRARIEDPQVREGFRFFVDYCYVAALARSKNVSGPYALNPYLEFFHDDGSNEFNHFREGFSYGKNGRGFPVKWLNYEGYAALSVDLEDGTTVNCKELALKLQVAIGEEIQRSHLSDVKEIASSYRTDLTRTGFLYAERLIYNELFGGTPAAGLEKTFTAHTPSAMTFGELFMKKSQMSSPALPRSGPAVENSWQAAQEGAAQGWASVTSSVSNGWEMAKEGVTYGFAWLTKEISPIYARYMVVMMAPVLYGIVLMILLAAFPLVAVFALLPFKWQVALNFAKLLGSVKLWPLFWTMVGKIESSVMAPGVEELFTTHEVSASSVALAAAAMYLVVPALSYLVVSLATSVIAMPFPQVQGGGAPDGYKSLRDAGGALGKAGDVIKSEMGQAGNGRLPVGLRGGAAGRGAVK